MVRWHRQAVTGTGRAGRPNPALQNGKGVFGTVTAQVREQDRQPPGAESPWAAEKPGRRRWWNRVREFYLGRASLMRATISILIGAVIWEFAARTVLKDSIAFASLTDVYRTFIRLAGSGELLRHTITSGQEFVGGFAVACAIGIPLGLIIGTSDAARDYLDPWMSALYSTPTLSLAPLFIIWFGIGIKSKIAVVFLLSIFPIVINTATGIRSTDPHLIEAARSFGARRLQVFTKVLIPSALAFIVAGVRLGIGRGLVGVFAGELFGAQSGLGYLIVAASQMFDTAGLFVGVFCLAGAGILSVALLERLERRMAPWRDFERRF